MSAMDARTFIEKHAADVERVCTAAGTKPVYLRQMAGGHRRPSAKLAQRLAEASEGRMDVMSLLFPPAREPVATPTTPEAA